MRVKEAEIYWSNNFSTSWCNEYIVSPMMGTSCVNEKFPRFLMEIYAVLFHPLKGYICSLYVYDYVYVYMCICMYNLSAGDLPQACGPPGATEDTGEFTFTWQPPKWFQNDLNPTGMFALLVKVRMHKDTVGDNLAWPRESVGVKKVKLKEG